MGSVMSENGPKESICRSLELWPLLSVHSADICCPPVCQVLVRLVVVALVKAGRGPFLGELTFLLEETR